MFKNLFGQRPTTKSDIVLAAAGAAMAVWKTFDTVQQYRIEQETKEIEK